MDREKYLADLCSVITDLGKSVHNANALIEIFNAELSIAEEDSYPRYRKELNETKDKELSHYLSYCENGTMKEIRNGYHEFVTAFRTDVIMWGIM